MFTKFPSEADRHLEGELVKALKDLRTHQADSKEYGEILDRVSRINEMIGKRKSSINPDVALTVAANLLGILLIIRHEQFNVITSKAIGFVIRPR